MGFDYSLLTSAQQEMVLGTMFGDGCLKPSGRGALYYVSHGDKQKDYFDFKVRELRGVPHSPERVYVHKTNGGKYYQISFRDPYFGLLYELFYPDGKKLISGSMVRSLTDRALAFWYGDDGSTERDNRPGFNASDRASLHISDRNLYPFTECVIAELLGGCRLKLYRNLWRFRLNSEVTQALGRRLNPYLQVMLPSKVIRPRTAVRRYVHSGTS